MAYNDSFEGLLHLNQTAASGATGTSEQTLMTYTFPAYEFNVTGQALRIRGVGKHAANTNNVTWKLYFGATSISSGTSSSSGELADLELLVCKSGSSTQNVFAKGKLGTTNLATALTAGTDSDAANITIKLTATGGTTGADATAELLSVEFLQAP